MKKALIFGSLFTQIILNKTIDFRYCVFSGPVFHGGPDNIANASDLVLAYYGGVSFLI